MKLRVIRFQNRQFVRLRNINSITKSFNVSLDNGIKAALPKPIKILNSLTEDKHHINEFRQLVEKYFDILPTLEETSQFF